MLERIEKTEIQIDSRKSIAAPFLLEETVRTTTTLAGRAYILDRSLYFTL